MNRDSEIEKCFAAISGVRELLQKLQPQDGRKLSTFHILLKAEVPIKFTLELKETFDSVNKALRDACELALKQPFPGKQLDGRKPRKRKLCPHD